MLNSNKTYKGLVAKNILSKEPLDLKNGNLIAIVIYSNKLRDFVRPYIETLKNLKESHNINYFIITMDSEYLTDITDLYQD